MGALAILLLSDGKPGHFRLSEGIVAAIARRHAVTVTRVEIRRPWWLPGRVLAGLVNGRAADGMVLRALGGLGSAPLRLGIVVSAGGDTLAANVALARIYGCANIFYGSLRRFNPDQFSLVLTSYAADADRANRMFALKPSAFDPAQLTAAVERSGGPRTIGLLIGGDSGTVRYAVADWDRLIGLFERGRSQRWIAANSRRTPDGVSDRIAQVAAQSAGRVRFIDVRDSAAPALTTLLAEAEVVAVTVDSSSMLSEAIWARRPVVALVPEQGALPRLEQEYRDTLEANGWMAVMPLATTTGDHILAAADRLTPLDANPLDQLADVLEAHLPVIGKAPPLNCRP